VGSRNLPYVQTLDSVDWCLNLVNQNDIIIIIFLIFIIIIKDIYIVPFRHAPKALIDLHARNLVSRF